MLNEQEVLEVMKSDLYQANERIRELEFQKEKLRKALKLAVINLGYSDDVFSASYMVICKKALETTEG